MLFTEFPLHERLQQALTTAQFVTPTPIQAEALPVALAGHDLVGTAQTGTGKTAAFVLPILQQILANPLEVRKTRAIILAPTRELVEQILDVVRTLGCHTNIRAAAVYGGMSMQPQVRALRNGVEIIVACPGRLLDHISRHNTDFRHVDFLVLDEADRMLDMGFMPPILEIINGLPVERQTMLFSATFAKTLNAFVQKTLREPKRVEVDTAVPAQTVQHSLYQLKSSMKYQLLTSLLRKLTPDSDSVLIFTRTRVTANQVAEHLHKEGMQVGVLHSEKTQRARQDTLEHFRSGHFPYLVATDVAARGIDVTCISHVINFDIPACADDYLHRIGRTGRMERTGYAITLVTKSDTRMVREIEHMLKSKIEIVRLEGLDEPQVHGFQPPLTENKSFSRKRPVSAYAADRPMRQRHQPAQESSQPMQHNDASMAPAPRAARPEPRRRDIAPPQGEYRKSFHNGATPTRPQRADQAGRRPYSEQSVRAEQPRRRPDMQAPSESLPREERRRVQFGDPAKNRVRPTDHRFSEPATREGKQQRQRPGSDATPPAMTRAERRRLQFGEPFTKREQQTERPEQRRFTEDPSSVSNRRERPAESRFTDTEAAGRPAQDRHATKAFTGMAAVSKHRHQFAAGKRQPGEVSSSAHQPGNAHSARSKRPAGRQR